MIKPIGKRVLIKGLKEETTASGLVLPESVNDEKKEQGEIVALGSSEKLEKAGLSIGQKIVFGGWPKEIKDNGETYKIVELDDILAIIE